MKIPKVSPQVNNLPSPQPDQHSHCPECKPFNTLISTLIGIPQSLLTSSEIFHFLDNLANQFFDAPKIRLDGLELFLSLNGGPVTRIGADVDIEFNGAVNISTIVCTLNWSGQKQEPRTAVQAERLTSRNKLIFKTDIKRSIRRRRKRLSLLADNIFRVTMFVP